MTTPNGPLAEHLRWAKEIIPTLKWRWAKSFKGGAEHSYVVRGTQLDEDDYCRLFRTVQAFGVARKFYKRINVELLLPEVVVNLGERGNVPALGVKLWPMTNQTSVTKIINIAPITSAYGVQDAPDTRSAYDVPDDDWNASDLADRFPSPAPHRSTLWKLLCADQPIPSLLDLGPRLGWAFDAGLVSKATRYLGLEPSQAMLNQIAYRRTADVMAKGRVVLEAKDPYDWFDEEAQGDGESFHTAVALYGTANRLPEHVIETLGDRRYTPASRALLMFDAQKYDFDPARLEQASKLRGARKYRLGQYLMVGVNL